MARSGEGGAGGAVAAMFGKYYITSKTQIQYQCATANCAYFRLTDGGFAMLPIPTEITGRRHLFSSDIAARNYFMERTGGDYSFIILMIKRGWFYYKDQCDASSEAAGIAYRTAEYEYDEANLSGLHAAEQVGMDAEQVFKTLVTRGDKTGILVFCIPVDMELI